MIKEKEKMFYRFRPATDYNVKALAGDFINGTLYKVFEQCGEANYCLTEAFKEKRNITSQQANKFVEAIRNNTLNKYFLASFTTNRPNHRSEEWIEYAHLNGFCLVTGDRVDTLSGN